MRCAPEGSDGLRLTSPANATHHAKHLAGGGEQLARDVGGLLLLCGRGALKTDGRENELNALNVGCGVLQLLVDELREKEGGKGHGEEVVAAPLLEEGGDGARWDALLPRLVHGKGGFLVVPVLRFLTQ